MRDDRVEQVTVMRDDDHRPFVLADEFLQEHLAGQVEMIVRFVEQQNIGADEQQPRQPDQFLLSAAQHGQGLGQLAFGESQPEEHFAHALGIGVAAEGVIFFDELVLSFEGALQSARVTVDFGIAQTRFDLFEFSMDFRYARVASERGGEGRQRQVKLGLLRQVSGREGTGAGNASAQFGRMFSLDQFEQRGLPRAVRADESDSLSALDLPVEIFEDAFCAEDEGDVGELDLDHVIPHSNHVVATLVALDD